MLEDDAFDAAVSTLRLELRRLVEDEPRLLRAIGDAGAFAIVVCAIGLAEDGDGTFTFAQLQAIIVPRRWASGRRVRSLIDWLEWSGAALRHSTPRDGRERPWSLCGWLLPSISGLARAFVTATAPWRRKGNVQRPPEDVESEIEGLVRAVGRCFVAEPLPVPAGAETRLFASHAAGLLVLLDLVDQPRPVEAVPHSVRFSRKAASRIYGVSRAHVTAILARAEDLQFLVRNGDDIVLTETLLCNVRRDLARQLAFVVLAGRRASKADTV